MEFASNAKANAGLTTGIIGTAGFGLSLLNGLLGVNPAMAGAAVCHENMPVNRYEAEQAARIAELETEVKLRDANTFTMGEMGKLRDYVERKFDHVEHELCEQKAYNAANNATLGCISGQVAQLYGLTKLIIPNTSICPGWGNVTVAPEAAAVTTP